MKTAATITTALAILGIAAGLASARTVSDDTSFSISGRRNTRHEINLVVPNNTDRLTIRTQGGYGDLDLYLYRGGQSSGRGELAKSTGSNTSERIILNNPAPGRYNLVVHGYSSFGNATARIDFQRSGGWGGGQQDDKYDKYPQPGQHQLTLNSPIRNLDGSRGSSRVYRLQVRQGLDRLTIGTDFGTGDADLFVSRGRIPTMRSADWKSNGNSSSERIRLNNPTAGTYYVMVYAYRDYDNVTVAAKTTRTGNNQGGNNGGGYYQDNNPQGRLTTPTAGTVWTLGNSYTIRWQSSGVENVQVQFSTDGGRAWQRAGNMPASIDADRGLLTVNLPANGHQLISNQVRLRLIDVNRRSVLHTSGLFRVVQGRQSTTWPQVPNRPGRGRVGRGNHNRIVEGQTQQRRVELNGVSDRFTFQPTRAGRHEVRISNGQVDLVVEVMVAGPRGNYTRLTRTVVDDGDTETLRFMARPGRIYEIRIQAEHDNHSGRYNVSVQRG